MSINQQPFFRKTIPPWYDSDLVCVIQIICMGGVFLFGCAGIAAAGENTTYQGVLWVPALVTFLSVTVIFTTILRLIRRRE